MNAESPRPRRPRVARTLYLGLTVFALIFPARRYAEWYFENGFDLSALWAAGTANTLTLSLSGTTLVVTTATVIFILTECLARRDSVGLICIPITLMLGVAVGLPFYLFLRLRPRD